VTAVTARATTEPLFGPASAVSWVRDFPRLRYMGSKYRLVPRLAEVFTELGGRTALDAFSGSGVVSYLLKTLGYQVTANDFLTFPAVIARATVVNQEETLTAAEIEEICGPSVDDRDFIRRTFNGLYFTDEDREFLDSAWSHIDRMSGHKQDIAISALVLASARKQPRGVFTFTGLRYDDGRRDLHLPLRTHFRERASEYNRVVFDSGQPCTALSGDVFALAPSPTTLSTSTRPTLRPETTTATSSATTSLKDSRSTGVTRRSWKTRAPRNSPSATPPSPTSTR
jgi:adenine-specific DNA-methyltransferase